MKAYRLLVPSKYNKDGHNIKTDREALMILELPTPENLLRINRLFMITRLIKGEHKSILYLLSQSMTNLPNSWLNMVIQDISILWPVVEDMYGEDFEDSSPPTKAQVKHYIIDKSIKHRMKMRKRLHTWQANRHYVITKIVNNSAPTHACTMCDKVFRRPGRRALHMIKCHNVHPLTYYYISTNTCPICNKWCESIINVREQVIHSPTCYVKLVN
jgi:hypothetical protein